jgi:hypothetical protein
MGAEPHGLLGLFADPATAAMAIEELKKRGLKDLRTVAPAAFPELEAALGGPRSRIGWVTFAAALAGLAAGFALTVGTALSLPLVVGGKPVVSFPPFLVIAFECTILAAGIANFVSIVVGSWLARRTGPVPDDPRFGIDRVGVFLPGVDSPDARELLVSLGAGEVRP